MPDHTEYDGTNYRATRDALRRRIEGETVDHIDVDVNESGGVYVTEITFRMQNGDEIVFSPEGGPEAGDQRVAVSVLDRSETGAGA